MQLGETVTQTAAKRCSGSLVTFSFIDLAFLTSLVIENFISGLYPFLRKILAGMAKKLTGHRGRAFAEAMPWQTQSVTQSTTAQCLPGLLSSFNSSASAAAATASSILCQAIRMLLFYDHRHLDCSTADQTHLPVAICNNNMPISRAQLSGICAITFFKLFFVRSSTEIAGRSFAKKEGYLKSLIDRRGW